jgi:hypothetical protein
MAFAARSRLPEFDVRIAFRFLHRGSQFHALSIGALSSDPALLRLPGVTGEAIHHPLMHVPEHRLRPVLQVWEGIMASTGKATLIRNPASGGFPAVKIRRGSLSRFFLPDFRETDPGTGDE